MIPTIQSSSLVPSPDGYLVGEASSLGLPPGEWPQLLAVGRDAYRRTRVVNLWDDVAVVHYEADGLPPIHVLNS